MLRIVIVVLGVTLLASAASGADEGFAYGEPTPEEQLMLELINRARADPEAERIRLGVSAAVWPRYAPSPPLVMNAKLLEAARGHAQDMHDREFFAHMNPDGVNANARVRAAGYLLTKLYGANANSTENNAAGYATVLEAHDVLMIDEGLVPPNHRRLVLSDDPIWAENDEIGIGIFRGKLGYQNYYVQEIAHDDDPTPFVLGVVYRDANGNGFYDVGEGVKGVTVGTTDGTYSTKSSSSGGYGFRAAIPGTFTLRASGVGMARPVELPLVIADRNVKVDFALEPAPPLEVLRSSFLLSLTTKKTDEPPGDRIRIKSRIDPALLPPDLAGEDVTIEFGGVRIGTFRLEAAGRKARYRTPKGVLPRVSLKLSPKNGKLTFKLSRTDLLEGLGLAGFDGTETMDFMVRVSVGRSFDVTEMVTHVLKARAGKRIKGASRR